jgi:glycolate oxidase FAD binding subunit
MKEIRPSSIDDLQAAVSAHSRLRVRGGGTKPGLSSDGVDCQVLDLARLDAIVEYAPEECTFTAQAGARVSAVERMLADHGQYLPFDPPLVDAGATLGGTVASGVNGSCRYRYGGIRDFVIGARIVDGQGRAIRSGGKVVKNAAGFLLHQAMAGSCGAFGVIAEVTCKVFPAPEARATIRYDARDLAAALACARRLEAMRLDLEAIDVEPPGVLWLRVGGFAEAIGPRVDAIATALGAGTEVLRNDSDAAMWRAAREYRWLPEGRALVRVPVGPTRLAALDRVLERHDAPRRYALAGTLALVGWNGSIDSLSDALHSLELAGQVVIGPPGRPFIGVVEAGAFEQRLRNVMDPDRRFS